MPEIAWKQMIDMRHVLVHDYFDVDDTVVLDTVRVYLPLLAHKQARDRCMLEPGESAWRIDDWKGRVERI